MDRNLREMGAGDLGVGRRVKAMVKAFYGRVAAYEDGLASGPRVLAEALRRNLYRGAPIAEEQVIGMAAYVARSAALLGGQPAAGLMRGEIEFAGPPATAAEVGVR
jgi:cytochrome b pre-mRNA-processing protein 3